MTAKEFLQHIKENKAKKTVYILLTDKMQDIIVSVKKTDSQCAYIKFPSRHKTYKEKLKFEKAIKAMFKKYGDMQISRSA